MKPRPNHHRHSLQKLTPVASPCYFQGERCLAAQSARAARLLERWCHEDTHGRAEQPPNAEVREPAPHVVDELKARLRIDGVRRGQASTR